MDVVISDKYMNWNIFEQWQIFQCQVIGDGDFEVYIGKMFDCGNVCFVLCYVCGLCVMVVVINYLLNVCVMLLLCLFLGLVVGQFDLYVVVKFFCYVQCVFGGVDICIANYCYLVSVGFEVYMREDFVCIGNFGVCQYDFVWVKCFQIVNCMYVFVYVQNGIYFDNVDFFGNQVSGFVGVIYSLVVQCDL